MATSQEESKYNLLETLYVLTKANELKEQQDSYPFTYLDGKDMSARDIIRVAGMQIRDLRAPLSKWAANDRISKAKRKGYIEQSSTYSSHASPIRISFTLTIQGKRFLEEGLKDLKERYGPALDSIGTFPIELKEKLMPDKIVMIHT